MIHVRPLRLLCLGFVALSVAFACSDSGQFSSRGGESANEGGEGGMLPSSGDGDGDEAPGGQGGSSEACSCPSDEHCDEGGACVECLRSAHCGEAAPVCDAARGVCVGCLDHDDCGDAGAPICFADTLRCEPCEDDDSCGDLGNRCLDSGACVQCSPETDDRTTVDDDCGAGVCNPETFSCDVTRTQASKRTCEACISDSECPDGHNCVPMEFQGVAREGGFCLKDSSVEGCSENPFRSPTSARVSLSGAPATMYCGINEDLTTCEATLDLLDDQSCVTAEECGAPDLDDGLCEVVSLSAGKCTYACDSAAQCRASSPGAGCGGVGADYCGG